MTMAPDYVMVSYSEATAGALDRLLAPGAVLVVEEPDVSARRRVPQQVAAHPALAGVVEAPIQSAVDGPWPARLRLPDPPVAVFPGTEYGVRGAAHLAAHLGLPGVGPAPARLFTDKVALRRRLAGTAVRQPRWQEVGSVAALAAFAAGTPGGFVVKPATRQANLGVLLADGGTDPEVAWRTATRLEEPLRSAHAPPDRVLVEERLRGREVSVEVLVAAGQIAFANVTDKLQYPGAFPVEAGHTMPSDLPPPVRERLLAGMQEMIGATGVATAILHAEWMVADDGEPSLIECAARMPGDDIWSLAGAIRGVNLLRSYLDLMAGGRPEIGPPSGAAAVRFLHATPGTVVDVTGVDEAAELDGIVAVSVSVAQGDVVPPLLNCYQRIGHVTALGTDRSLVVAAVEEAASAISVRTVGEPARS
jgi:biotin carboxylase